MALQPKDIRDVWEVVKTGLCAVHNGSWVPWRPEDIYAACVNKQAVLYMDQASSPDGFIIVQSQKCPLSRDETLLLWVAFDPSDNSAGRFASQCESIAKNSGHSAVEFVTSIDPVGSLSEKFGYKKVSSLYRKELA